jgi:hypothetical protein
LAREGFGAADLFAERAGLLPLLAAGARWASHGSGDAIVAARDPDGNNVDGDRPTASIPGLRYDSDMGTSAAAQDPLLEALIRDVDMSLIRRNLQLTPQQRIDQLVEMQRFAAELAKAGRKARESK